MTLKFPTAKTDQIMGVQSHGCTATALRQAPPRTIIGSHHDNQLFQPLYRSFVDSQNHCQPTMLYCILKTQLKALQKPSMLWIFF